MGCVCVRACVLNGSVLGGFKYAYFLLDHLHSQMARLVNKRKAQNRKIINSAKVLHCAKQTKINFREVLPSDVVFKVSKLVVHQYMWTDQFLNLLQQFNFCHNFTGKQTEGWVSVSGRGSG